MNNEDLQIPRKWKFFMLHRAMLTLYFCDVDFNTDAVRYPVASAYRHAGTHSCIVPKKIPPTSLEPEELGQRNFNP